MPRATYIVKYSFNGQPRRYSLGAVRKVKVATTGALRTASDRIHRLSCLTRTPSMSQGW